MGNPVILLVGWWAGMESNHGFLLVTQAYYRYTTGP